MIKHKAAKNCFMKGNLGLMQIYCNKIKLKRCKLIEPGTQPATISGKFEVGFSNYAASSIQYFAGTFPVGIIGTVASKFLVIKQWTEPIILHSLVGCCAFIRTVVG